MRTSIWLAACWLIPWSSVAFSVDYLDHQRTPLAITAKMECTTTDPTPILAEKQPGATAYKRSVSTKKPIETREGVRFADGSWVRIKQIGCADLQAEISVTVGASCKNVVHCSLERLDALVFDPKGTFVDQITLSQMTAVLKVEEGKTLKKNKTVVVCLNRLDPKDKSSECVTDLKVVVTKTGVTLSYVNRP